MTKNEVNDWLDKRERDARTAGSIAAAKGKVVAARLNGIASLAGSLPDTADENELNAAADKLAVSLNLTRPAGSNTESAAGVEKPPVDLAKLSAYDRMQYAVSQKTAGHNGGRLFDAPATAAPVVAAEKDLTPHERFEHAGAAQLRAIGL